LWFFIQRTITEEVRKFDFESNELTLHHASLKMTLNVARKPGSVKSFRRSRDSRTRGVTLLTILSIDLGGSHITCAAVRGREVLAEEGISTDARLLAENLNKISVMLHHCILASCVNKAELRGIAVGYCGIVDAKTGSILSTLNKYTDCGEIDLQAWAAREFQLPLRLENDACLALLGEVYAGAAQGAKDVVMITLGTGIGGAAMIGGRLLRSHAGQAGCLGGHLPVNLHGRRCTCGALGCAEAEASSAVLPTLCREHPAFAGSYLAQQEVLNFEALFRALDANDSVAEEVLNHCLHVWSVLTVGLIHAYGPELVLFGGGVMRRGTGLLDPIREYVGTHAWRTSRGLPRIARAQLGDRAALLGGMKLFDGPISEGVLQERQEGTHVRL
jgi:glucokinase